MKKYKLKKKKHLIIGKTFYKIKALKDFGKIKKGTIGGLVENENNLSQDGDCWIGRNSKVWDKARISEGAKIRGNSIIKGNIEISGNIRIFNAQILADISNEKKIITGDTYIMCERKS